MVVMKLRVVETENYSCLAELFMASEGRVPLESNWKIIYTGR